MRLPYVPNPPPSATPEDAAVVARIKSRRAPKPLQSLDLALLHSPPVADGWNSFLGAIRERTSLAADVRELAICRVAVCNEAWYEWDHHAPLAAEAGVSPAGLDAVKRHKVEGMDRPDELDDRQWAVLLYTDEMTRNVHVKSQTFDLLHTLFSNRQVVEITATVRDATGCLPWTAKVDPCTPQIAAYNCVSRFLVALNGMRAKIRSLYNCGSRLMQSGRGTASAQTTHLPTKPINVSKQKGGIYVGDADIQQASLTLEATGKDGEMEMPRVENWCAKAYGVSYLSEVTCNSQRPSSLPSPVFLLLRVASAR